MNLLKRIIRSFGRFVSWWLRTFRARGGRGKLLFGVGSPVAACLLCSIPLAVFSPAATPMPTAVVAAVPGGDEVIVTRIIDGDTIDVH